MEPRDEVEAIAGVSPLRQVDQSRRAVDADHVRTVIDGTQAGSAHGTRDMPVWGKVLATTGDSPRWSR